MALVSTHVLITMGIHRNGEGTCYTASLACFESQRARACRKGTKMADVQSSCSVGLNVPHGKKRIRVGAAYFCFLEFETSKVSK